MDDRGHHRRKGGKGEAETASRDERDNSRLSRDKFRETSRQNLSLSLSLSRARKTGTGQS